MPAPDSSTIRLLDASLNRVTEGLRVVDDYVRFILDDAHLTRLAKQIRHDLVAAAKVIPREQRYASRNMAGDVGASITTESETTRQDATAVCQASCERTKQSLRSLEEYSKLFAGDLAAQFEQLRYRFYELEAALGRTLNSRERLRDVRLCVLINGCETEAAFCALVGQLIDAGVGMIQLRDKKLGDRELQQRAEMLVGLTTDSTTLAIINDRADIAATAGADGVHLGQDDLSPIAARKIIGPDRLIGVSTHSIEQARRAVIDGANYLGAGPTFPSQTKSFDEFPGLEYLQQVATEIALPTFAIGGINTENAGQVIETGVERIAVCGAVTQSKDREAAIRKLLKVLR